MTPNWAKLGLREPDDLDPVMGDGDGETVEWENPSDRMNHSVQLRRYPNGSFIVRTWEYQQCGVNVKEVHDTIESAAAHLIRLGCGKEPTDA